MVTVLHQGGLRVAGYGSQALFDGTATITLTGGSYLVATADPLGNISWQRYGADGSALGAAGHVAVNNPDARLSIMATSDGGFTIFHTSDRQADYFQHYLADGTPDGAAVVLPEANGVSGTSLTDGSYLVTWSNNGIHVRHYAANGSVIGGDVVLQDSFIRIAASSGGGFVAVSDNGQTGTIEFQHFDSSLHAIGNPVVLVANPLAGIDSIVRLSDGGYAVTWSVSSRATADQQGVYIQKFDAAGTAAGPADHVSSDPTAAPSAAAALPGGGYILALKTGTGVPNTLTAISTQVFDDHGAAVGPQVVVTSDLIGYPGVAGLADGGYVVTWDYSTADTYQLRTGQQVYSPTANLNGTTYLYGTSGADTLDGGSGGDFMYGGAGDDTYGVHSSNDTVFENHGAGIDTVISTTSYTLTANVENLTLAGTRNVYARGNDLDNALKGNAGDNTLDGKGGADSMSGGAGNDTYIVDSHLDTITEAANKGTDTVISSVSYILGANLENLTLSGTDAINGTGNRYDNVLTGNIAANVLDGGVGADTMSGGKGDDTYYVENAGDVVIEAADQGTDTVISHITYTLGADVENLTLTGTANHDATGNRLDNTLIGNDADNVLDGRSGDDVMIGGGGSDIYVVNDTGDLVVEYDDPGVDRVKADISYTLGDNVEYLTLTGSLDIDGTGNALTNIIGGNSGNNVLDGGAGADTLYGRAGNDTFVVDNTFDRIVEYKGDGTDTVMASASFRLSDEVEILILTGAGNIDATGNFGANSLFGNSGNNVLDGSRGNDNLTGGTGSDTFLFHTNSGLDSIKDFSVADNDHINLDDYARGTAHAGWIVQSGSDVVITMGAGQCDHRAPQHRGGRVRSHHLVGGNTVRRGENRVAVSFSDTAATLVSL
ncbi:MAG: calcium-binding protein [Asticcacaulis sp.]